MDEYSKVSSSTVICDIAMLCGVGMAPKQLVCVKLRSCIVYAANSHSTQGVDRGTQKRQVCQIVLGKNDAVRLILECT